MWMTSAFSDSTRAGVWRRPGEKDHLRHLSRGRLAAAQQLVQAVVVHRNVQQRVHALQALLPRRRLHPGLRHLRSLSMRHCNDGSVTRAVKYACMHLEALRSSRQAHLSAWIPLQAGIAGVGGRH